MTKVGREMVLKDFYVCASGPDGNIIRVGDNFDMIRRRREVREIGIEQSRGDDGTLWDT